MANKFLFNPLSGQFDLVNDGAAGIPTVQSESNLPASANDGALYIVRDTDQTYIFNVAANAWTTTGIVIEAPGAPDGNGISTSFEQDGSVIRPTIQLHEADSSNPGIVSFSAQSFGGTKSFTSTIIAEQGIDSYNGPGSNLEIGTQNAEFVTIGNPGATVIIYGTTEYNNVTDLEVQDKLITINNNGSETTGGDSGLQIEEGDVITGYAKTSVDRNMWTLKAPGTDGIAYIVPGTGQGILLNQSSHDKLTIDPLEGGHGLYLANQELGINIANNLSTGALSATDHLRFSNSADLTEAADVVANPDTLVLRDENGDTGIRVLRDFNNVGSISIPDRSLYTQSGATTFIWDNQGVIIPYLDVETVVVNNNNGQIRSSITTTTELEYVSGVTSPIQTQLTNKADRNANDISLSSATLANNQVATANVVGLTFPNANVRSAQVQYSITIITTGTNLYEEGTLRLVQRGSDWTVARSFDGDDSLVNLDITNAGQVTYTSSNYTGFVSGTLKFRATVTTI